MKVRSRRDGVEQLSLKLPGKPARRADRAEPDEVRLVWLLLVFVRKRRVRMSDWIATFAASVRTFDRDVAKLRALGKTHGFRVGPRVRGVVELRSIDGVLDPMRKPDELAADALLGLVDALGDVIGNSLRGHVDLEGRTLDRFLRFATPRLDGSSEIGKRYLALRDAWTRKARVRFRYPSRDGSGPVERSVEPYLVSYHSGLYYLVAFDPRRRSGWRQYALDRIDGEIRRDGTYTPRAIPAAYSGEDAVGLFKRSIGDARVPSVEVTIELSPVIAAAVSARTWQRAQRIERVRDRVTITFVVHDLGEAVRWAFGFGAQARIVSPPAAVDLARETASQIGLLYENASSANAALA